MGPILARLGHAAQRSERSKYALHNTKTTKGIELVVGKIWQNQILNIPEISQNAPQKRPINPQSTQDIQCTHRAVQARGVAKEIRRKDAELAEIHHAHEETEGCDEF